MPDIIRRVNEIRVKKSLGIEVVYEYDFPWLGPVNRCDENIISALQHLENPISRLKEELNWFWIYDERDKDALQLLHENKRREAHNIWFEEVPDEGCASKRYICACFNQFILAHSSVLAKELEFKYLDHGSNRHKSFFGKLGFISKKDKQSQKPKDSNIALDDKHWKNWKFALSRLLFLNSHPVFWDIVIEKAQNINDPRLSTSRLAEIKQRFLHDLTEASFAFIAQALNVKDYSRAKYHAGLISGLRFPAEVVRDGLNRVLLKQIELLNSKCASLKAGKYKFSERNTYFTCVKEIEDIIFEASQIDISCLSDFTLARDNAAEIIRNLSVWVHNEMEYYSKAYELINKAKVFAVSVYLKQRIQKDAEVLKKHLDIITQGHTQDATSQSDGSYPNFVIVDHELTPYFARAQSTTSTKPSKKIWGSVIGAIAILCFVIFSVMQSSRTAKGPPRTHSYSQPYRGSRDIANLKTNIESLRASIEDRVNLLKQNKQSIEFKENELRYLKLQIEGIESKWNNALSIPNYIKQDYDKKIEGYNARVQTYNNLILQSKNLYAEVQKQIKQHDNLVEIYNQNINR